MRIVYLHQYFVTPEMSGGTRSYEMARRWTEAGHDVHMVTADTRSEGPAYQTVESGISVTWIPVPYSNDMGKWARIRSFFHFAFKSARVATSKCPDAVFATSTPLTIALPAIWAKWRCKVPMVFEVRDLWPETPIGLGVLKDPISIHAARLLERIAYKNADVVVALSDGMKAGVVATGYPEDRVYVITNASDNGMFPAPDEVGLEFRKKYTWLGDRPFVVYAGTLGYANDVQYMVRLAAAVRDIDPHIRFATFGTGGEEAAVRQLASEVGVLDQTFFMLDRVPKRELPHVLSAATVATSWVRNVPAMHANSANKFFDTLAAQRPIIINHEGWQADVIRESLVGLVLPADDVDTASRNLVSKLRDPQWLSSTSQRAGELARSRYDRDVLAERVLTILGSVVATEPGQGSS